MTEYLKQREAIANPFANRSYQSRPKVTPVRRQAIITPSANRSNQFRPKATSVRRYKLVTFTRPHKDKLSKPRKINVGYHPEFMQRNWLIMIRAKEASAAKQAPTSAQPAKASAAQCHKSPKYCAICSPLGKLCPNEYAKMAD